MVEFRNLWQTSEQIHSPTEINQILDYLGEMPTVTYRKVTYYNISAAFDIETSSFYTDDNEKAAIMYEWTFGMNGIVIIGRTWDEFFNMLRIIAERLALSKDNRLVVYVHNLAYEFQFIRKHLNWLNVFSIEERKPIYALCDLGIEFRCSYILSNYSLAKLGEQLHTYKVQKMVGDLNYDLIRTKDTELTKKELMYCVNDVRVVMAYIQEKIETENSIAFIPHTNTGYVRNYCRNYCFYKPHENRNKSFKKLRYMSLMSSLTLDLDEYEQLQDAFQGGFTHASALWSGKVAENVTSWDFTSSYPTVMLCERFPMSSCERIDNISKSEFYESIKLYCCLFDVKFEGLQSKFMYENYISESMCHKKENARVDNGRIESADSIVLTITEQDFIIIMKTYTWKHMYVSNFKRYMRGYLPKDFIKAILKLYENKTKLKNVENKEQEYGMAKAMLNSTYGMSVTSIIREIITYTNDWGTTEPDKQKVIDKYNKSAMRFLFYPWGVWITAYARRNLWTGILECGEDYVYSDTDSIKIINSDKHMDYINKYNDLITKQLIECMDYYNIPHDSIAPETIDGVKKPIGVWDFDGNYSRFKTLGAKRYMVEYSDDPRNGKNKGKISITVSGLNKKVCVPYLLNKYGDEVFEHFDDNLYVPPEYTGKNTHTYIDEEISGTIKDYQGNETEYHELSCVHLEKADYSLSIGRAYIDYLLNVKKGVY